MSWISVKDSLPSIHKAVHICCKYEDKKFYLTGYRYWDEYGAEIWQIYSPDDVGIFAEELSKNRCQYIEVLAWKEIEEYKEDRQPTWIRVEDKLPPPAMVVLCCNNLCTYIGFIAYDGTWFEVNRYDKDRGSCQHKATHWQPLPEPPGELNELG